MLRAFARQLQHPAQADLERPFVHYVGNQPIQARQHFWGLREAVPDLCGFALFDHLVLPPGDADVLKEYSWKQREIESYICAKDVLTRWAREEGSLFEKFMIDSIAETEAALRQLDLGSPWDGNLKVSEQFLTPVFKSFYEKTGMSSISSKSDFYFLVAHIKPDMIDSEIVDVLDAIHGVAASIVAA